MHDQKKRSNAKRPHVLDTEKSVVLGHTFRASRGTSLDLTDAKGDREVGNERVFGLAATVGHHDTPAVGLSELSTVHRGQSQCMLWAACIVELTLG